MSRPTYSKKIIDAAGALTRLTKDPAYAGTKWTWYEIGDVLGLKIREAHQVIYYLRENAVDVGELWTVGTSSSGWLIEPTGTAMVALDGLLNQQFHLCSRLEAQAVAWEVLAIADPDPKWSRAARRQQKMFSRWVEETRDNIEALQDLRL